MKKPSDKDRSANSDLPLGDDWAAQRDEILGLGADSVRKSHYSALRERLAELERFRSLLDVSSDLLFVLDIPSGRICDVNQTACERLERAREDLFDTEFVELLDDQHRPIWDQSFAKLVPGVRTSTSVTVDLRALEGQPFPAELAMREVTIGDECFAIISARDITERKRAEKALRMTQAAVDHAADAMYWVRPDGSFAYVNEAACNSLGYTREKLLGMRVVDIDPHRNPSIWKQRWEDIKRRGQMLVETCHQAKDGRVFPVEVRANYVEFGGQEYNFAFIRDITERKQAEEALRASSERLNFALRAARMGTWEWDIANNTVIWSPETERIFGLAPGQFGGNYEAYARFVAPESRDEVNAFVWQFLEGSNEGAEIHYEHRIVRANGESAWIEVRGTVFQDEEGRPVRLTGVCLDITERKRAENELAQTKALLAAAIEQSPAGILIADAPDVKIRMANSAALGIRGKAAEPLTDIPFELHQQNWQTFHADGTPFASEDLPLTQALRHGKTSRNVDVIIRRSNGEERWVMTNAAPVKNAEGETIAAIVVFPDITDRKRAEEALLREKAFSETILESLPGMFYLFNRQAELLRWNREFQQISGYSTEELQGIPAWAFFRDEDQLEGREKFVEAFEQGHVAFEGNYLAKDGHTTPYFCTGTRFLIDGVPHMLGVGIDVSDMKRAEAALRESEAMLAEMGDTARIGGWEHDLTTGKATWTKTLFDLIEVESGEPPGVDTHLDYYSPEDRQVLEDAYGRAMEAGEPFDLELRCHTAKGRPFWCRIIGRPVFEGDRCVRLHGTFQDITKRKQAEEALQQSERTLATLMSNLPGMAYRCLDNRQWTMLFLSQGCLELTGYEPEQLLHNRELSYVDLIHPDDRQAVYHEVDDAIAAGREFALSYRILTRQGKLKWVWEKGRQVNQTADGTAIIEGFVGDITERKQAEVALRESREKLLQIVEGSTIPTLIIGADHTVIHWNKACESLLGVSVEGIVGSRRQWMPFYGAERPIMADLLVDGADEAKLAEYYGTQGLRRVEATGAYEAEDFFPILGKQGKWLFFTAALLRDSDGNTIGAMETFQDISDRKQVEREIQKLNAELELRVHQRTEQLESVNRELTEFAYVISHDLKAPLRAVGQLAHWIAEDHADALNDDGKHKVELMLGRVARMYALIDGVLAYSRVGRVRERKEPVDLDLLVPDVVELLSPPENIEVVVEGKLPVVVGERTRVQQVFQNLLSNAVKFMDKPCGMVRIGCENEGNSWRFWVRDNGPGIDPKYHEKIFGIFQALVPRDQQESTGVGLAVVKKIVELYGGKVWLESEVGEGTTFYFTLPREQTP